jgi:hypothetical protein
LCDDARDYNIPVSNAWSDKCHEKKYSVDDYRGLK